MKLHTLSLMLAGLLLMLLPACQSPFMVGTKGQAAEFSASLEALMLAVENGETDLGAAGNSALKEVASQWSLLLARGAEEAGNFSGRLSTAVIATISAAATGGLGAALIAFFRSLLTPTGKEVQQKIEQGKADVMATRTETRRKELDALDKRLLNIELKLPSADPLGLNKPP